MGDAKPSLQPDSGETDAKLAARRAYEADAYLSNADVIVKRLFLASYDLEQFVDAVHWCDEGQQRFPNDFKFVRCQLWLLTTRAKEPDVALAWKLADSLPKVGPAGRERLLPTGRPDCNRGRSWREPG